MSDASDTEPTSGRASILPRPVEEPAFSLRMLGFLEHLGLVAHMVARTTRALFKRPFEGRAILTQLESLGVKSLGIVVVTSIFIGMVMAVQFAFGLRKFGGMEYTGRVVGLSFARELAPTLTAVIVGGRIGAGMAAEVGSMAVTEQIDALRALGADPYKKLVLPRVFAAILVMPVLGALALVLGFTGAMLITDFQFGIPSSFFFYSALGTVTMKDFVSGMIKTPFFGAIIALVGCHFGMITRGGTEGVGNSTTRTVVVVSISILIADFFLTKASIALMPGF
ncbi:MAG: ABC transporter permease [Polyangiaceae bacterium]|nr:ABC transporter permease [Polyangiaceae bacterium]MBK8999424.1 ABC transporter permease [Myxococcales bacterium]MCE7891889.1 ABC transporter permease [Sorangiineae bacterium PRO1]MCL4756073.1 ABC transporter permease [Myxococcales bacterium]